MKKPPNTHRYCLACEKKTQFAYNRNIGHSECVECGGRFALRESPNA
jgi:Zn ribbon nucleic-acid-binding protein